jgi:fatty-acyl-CoA synthase
MVAKPGAFRHAREMALLIGDLFRRNAAAAPHAVAAEMEGTSLTHAELDRAGNRVAHALAELGIGRGDRVVTWSDTSLDVLPLFVALAKLGAVFAPANARHGAEEAMPVVESARAKLLVADAARIGVAQQVARQAGVSLLARFSREDGPGIALHPEELPPADDDLTIPDLDERDPHVVFFTSGSTGKPKGVVLSHRANYLRTFQGVFRDEPERSVCMFPLFHMAAFTLALAAWQTRGEIVFVKTPTADALLDAVERRRANRLYCIPAVWSRILQADTKRRNLSSLVQIDTGTSATPPELIHALRERFPEATIRIYYGSTECGTGAALSNADVMRKPGSVGVAPVGGDLRLAANGEICVRSDTLMDGYFENPAATAEALQDGWYHTGDLGALDDEGYLQVTGRLKDVIRTGGETISPTEVEGVLAKHPDVAEVAVVGLPDPDWGEVVCAVVVAREGATPTLESLQRHCDESLAAFKKPRRLERADSLPRTPATGQIQRPLLVERIASQLD